MLRKYWQVLMFVNLINAVICVSRTPVHTTGVIIALIMFSLSVLFLWQEERKHELKHKINVFVKASENITLDEPSSTSSYTITNPNTFTATTNTTTTLYKWQKPEDSSNDKNDNPPTDTNV